MALLELILLVLRALQALFAIIVLGLTAYFANLASFSQDSFLLFVSLWTILILIYVGLFPRFAPSLSHVFAVLALDALTMLFWFAGFIAMAVEYHKFKETYLDDFTDGYAYSFCSLDNSDCSKIAAIVAFGALEWLLFVITTVFAVLEGLNSRRKGRAGPGPVTA